MNLLIFRFFPKFLACDIFVHAAKRWTLGIHQRWYKKPSRIFRVQKCWFSRSWPPNLKTTYCWMSSRFLCNIFLSQLDTLAGIVANKKSECFFSKLWHAISCARIKWLEQRSPEPLDFFEVREWTDDLLRMVVFTHQTHRIRGQMVYLPTFKVYCLW